MPLVRLIARDSCYPLEECLQVCEAAGHTEASAILSEEIGSYVESVKLYLKHFWDSVNLKTLRRELYFLSKHYDSKAELPMIAFVDTTFKKIR